MSGAYANVHEEFQVKTFDRSTVAGDEHWIIIDDDWRKMLLLCLWSICSIPVRFPFSLSLMIWLESVPISARLRRHEHLAVGSHCEKNSEINQCPSLTWQPVDGIVTRWDKAKRRTIKTKRSDGKRESERDKQLCLCVCVATPILR